MTIHFPIWLLWVGGVVVFLLFVGILAYAYVGYKVINAFNNSLENEFEELLKKDNHGN